MIKLKKGLTIEGEIISITAGDGNITIINSNGLYLVISNEIWQNLQS